MHDREYSTVICFFNVLMSYLKVKICQENNLLCEIINKETGEVFAMNQQFYYYVDGHHPDNDCKL